MEDKISKAIEAAKKLIEQSKIEDIELRKIAFSKAIDYFLADKKLGDSLQPNFGATKIEGDYPSGFWDNLSGASDISVEKLKDVYSIKAEQVLVVLPKTSIKGDTKADQQRFLSALVSFAYHEGIKCEWVSASLLAEAAKHSGLYDTTKFAKNVGGSEWFRTIGKKKGVKYKLSSTGISEIKNYLKELAV
ncbi:MAG: hypothetical protein Q7R98_01950 [Candidatus Jorgensenbacteria bacterium]|nr:hypothetical protein [Candidatus Jorgensenbacteria bacterium]